MLQTYLNRYFDFLRYLPGMLVGYFSKYSLPLLCALGGAGIGVYLYGSRKLSRLYAQQREQQRMHPDDPAPALSERARQTALAYEIAGFIILLVSCLGMLLMGHFDEYLALIGIGG